jgi:hypothetical protein
MIRMSVLWQQASHLLLNRTDSGYGTVLTAACARQGCSASDLVWFQHDSLNGGRPSQSCMNTEGPEQMNTPQVRSGTVVSVFQKATTTGKEPNMLSHQGQQIV